MAKPFSILRNKMSPKSRKRAEAKAKKILAEMQLQELREQQNQEKFAESLINQFDDVE